MDSQLDSVHRMDAGRGHFKSFGRISIIQPAFDSFMSPISILKTLFKLQQKNFAKT